ncbi:PTS system, mannose-specific IIB component [Fictibacillus solisalsi]|uniref:PTS system, mannose-specific IIB component n=1 Tax=Fictibacillus solisalsi TaxID=459525 RepID=A0A1H0BK91_9BACL|nr:PTS sugar transporter subunit IIB [Fictibacillus solisalsi]SDN46069.1 PTS system, mannose-specific IIB component [Fictibacillus solisalsi]
MITLLRIDDRLVHGQVAYAWTGALGANVILVSSDVVVNDEFKKMTLSLATPSGVKLLCKSIDDSIDFLNSGDSAKAKIFVLVDNSLDALRLAKGIKGLKAINVGGMRMQQGKKMVTPAVAVDQGDITNFREIESLGVEVEIRQVPSEKKKRLQNQ